jgi:uncharacterized protein (TIGR03083 family)
VPAPTDDPAAVYVDAANTFAQLIERIDPAAWDRPGLGVWDLRALVGHTSRALTTVLTYLDQPAKTEEIDSPQRYYTLAARQSTDPDAVAERGRHAGVALGPQPAAAVKDLLDQVTVKIEQEDPDALISTLGGGMRVSAYLPTRTFELVVHGLDIATATDLEVTFSPQALAHTAELATRIAIELGQATTVLTALTGRQTLPAGFSVVG